MNLLTILLLFNYIFVINCSQCNTFNTCGECIGYASARCVWCSQEKITTARCQPASAPKDQKWCLPKHIQNPESNITSSTEIPFSSKIQFKPQVLKLKLRPGLPINFTMSYRPAEDFPIDLYFLMDFSHTMKSQKEQLQNQALDIYNALNRMSGNVMLGIGSFIEKPGFPYSNYKLSKSYSFKNHLSLTKNIERFKALVSSLNSFGGNLDEPEAGLDALMQAMTCENEVGWRNSSRRIIVLATDGTYHSAGDGKMAGAYKPNDIKCHLRNNEYPRNETLLYDYPSVSQISTIATKGNFKIIFAALSQAKDEYIALANQILNAMFAELKAKSNIIDIIKRAYEELVQNVRLDYVLPKFVKLKIDQDCDSDPKINCQSNPSQLEVKIPASIHVTNCTSEGVTQKKFQIKPVGVNDVLTIYLDIDCSCPCDNTNHKPSDECSLFGFKQCGICTCFENRGGDKCQHNCTDEDERKFSENCKHDPNDKDFCSNHGSCRCGKCMKCDEGYSGVHCEYSIDQCPQPKGKRCSGNGECILGKCECDKDWSGDACECTNDNKLCMSPFSSKVCAGRGICECGECKCQKVPNKNEVYTGVFCDGCEECAKERCVELTPYARCNYDEEKAICNEKYNQTKDIDIFMLNKTEIESTKWGLAHKCEVAIENGKQFIFKYQVIGGSRKLRLLIQKELEEAPKANLWLAAGLSIGTVLLIGIITGVVWKILVDIYDKREYEKFCKAATEEGYDVSNPIYKEPAVHYKNPNH